MGQEILYCFKCQERVTSADLDSANALRFGNRTACKKCVPDLLASLTPQERKELVSRVQSPKKGTGRYAATSTPRPVAHAVAPSRSSPILLWVIGGVVVLLILVIVLLMGGSGSPPPARESAAPPAPRAPEESPRERNAKEAIAKAKGLQTSDPEEKLAGFEQAVRLSEGTSREREAKELRDEFIALRRKTYLKELAAVEERARAVQQKEEFGAALAIYEAVRGLHPGPEWKMVVESKIDEVRKAVEVLYATLKEQAAAAQAKRAEGEVKAIRDRVARWGLADKSADLEARLKSSTPPPPGLKWMPIFDGKSLDFLVMNGEGAWVLDNGGLLHVKGRKNSAQTKRHFTDGDLRVWFKIRNCSHVGFAVRQGEEGSYGVSMGGAELNQLDDKQHEFLISCRGTDVKAFLDDKPFPVEVNGKSLKGPLQFNAYGEYFVIKLLEFREPSESENPVGHWRFDGVSGGQVSDASGQGNSGTLVDGPVPVKGALGGALQFDGRKSHVSVESSPSLTITGPLSITAWVNPKASDDKTQARAIVEKWDGTASANFSGYLLRVTTRGSVQFVISEPARSSEVATTKPLPVDTWTFLAAVYDGANVRIYVNGTLDRTLPATATPGPSQGALRIGMGGGGGAHYFLGSIDDVRVYNRALSPEEVARIGAR